jgi:calpain, invertebrate
MYKTGEIPRKGYPNPKKVEWVFAEALCDPGEVPQFVDDGVACDDCVQGTLGDCWLISAMSVLATRDELLIGGRRGMEYDEDMIIDKEIASLLSNGVYPPIFHKFRSIGLFVIRIFKNFKWIYVVIDERIPVDIKSKQPVFGKCRDPHEMWVALIEKAYAKMHGCYENLISGYVDEGI